MPKVQQDWISHNCQFLRLYIPHLKEHHECPCKRFAIGTLGVHRHSCTQHAGATMGAHREHILTALQRLFTKAGYRTERKHVPHSRGLKKADLWIKDLQLGGIRNVIIDVTLRHEFHGSCANLIINGEPSHPDANGALDAFGQMTESRRRQQRQPWWRWRRRRWWRWWCRWRQQEKGNVQVTCISTRYTDDGRVQFAYFPYQCALV